jgi:hypothetical protein
MSFDKIAQNVDQPIFFSKTNAYPLKWKKSGPKIRVYIGTSVIFFYKTAQIKLSPMGENSPNLVTLALSSSSFAFCTRC